MDWQPHYYHIETEVNVISSAVFLPPNPPLHPHTHKPKHQHTHTHDFSHIQACSLLCKSTDKTLEAMLPLLMLLLLLFLPVLIKLGNPLSRQKRGERCFIIKEERDTPANIAPVNEKYSRVLQDLEISITWQSIPSTPPVRRIIQQPPLRLVAPFLVFLAGRADCRCCLRDKCSSTAFRFSCCFLPLWKKKEEKGFRRSGLEQYEFWKTDTDIFGYLKRCFMTFFKSIDFDKFHR